MKCSEAGSIEHTFVKCIYSSTVHNDEKSFSNEKAREVEETGRKSESHGMFVAVKFLKGTSVKQVRRSDGIRNDEGVVVTNEKDKTAVFTKYYESLDNPPTNADRELLREYEVQYECDG